MCNKFKDIIRYTYMYIYLFIIRVQERKEESPVIEGRV